MREEIRKRGEEEERRAEEKEKLVLSHTLRYFITVYLFFC